LERKAYIRFIAGRSRASRRYLMRARVRDTVAQKSRWSEAPTLFDGTIADLEEK